jgi:hypothetical protein
LDVDVDARVVERLVLSGDRYTIADDAVLTPDTFPGLALPLAELWAAADEMRAKDA